MATAPIFTSNPRSLLTQFNATYGTRFRPIWTPGSLGSRIEQIHIASTDSSANTVQLGVGKRLTLGSAMGSGLFVDGGGGSDTITRSVGNFIADGWQVGDRITIVGATSIANDFVAVLTAVASTTLTFATATVAVAEAFAAATGIYRLGFIGNISVPAAAGSGATAAASGLNPSSLPALDPSPDRNLRVDADTVVFAGVGTVLAANEIVDITVVGADY